MPTNRELQWSTTMNKLFITLATIGALAIAGPAFAQRVGPGSTAETGTGPEVIPPGGFGPSSSFYNVTPGYPDLPAQAPWGMVQQSAAPASPQEATSPVVTTQSR
jgi:hypothetical protein